MLRVLHVIPRLEATAGGPVAALIGQATAQVDAGLAVRVAAAHYYGRTPPASQDLQKIGIDVAPIGPVYTSFAWSFGTRKQLRPLLKGCDIVHIHALWEDIQHQVASLCREMEIPYIFRPCGMLDHWALGRSRPKKTLYWLLRLRRDINKAAAVHVATLWERDQVARLGLKPPLIVEPHGINSQLFNHLPQRGQFRAKYPVLKDRPFICFLGRVFPGKGVEMLIPALAKMADRSAMLAVVGPEIGSYGTQMRELARQLGVADRVVFTGMINPPGQLEPLVDSDLFSLPSEHENFGIAALEAMGTGRPAIVSDQVGLWREIVQAGAGEAVPLDASELAAALDRWLCNPSRREVAGQRAQSLVRERFTWNRIALRWANHYRELIGTPAPEAEMSAALA